MALTESGSSTIPLYLMNDTKHVITMLVCSMRFTNGRIHHEEQRFTISAYIFEAPTITFLGNLNIPKSIDNDDSGRLAANSTWNLSWTDGNYVCNKLELPLRASIISSRGMVVVHVVGGHNEQERLVRVNQEGQTFGKGNWEFYRILLPEQLNEESLRKSLTWQPDDLVIK